jgi:hypothetical protein
MLQTYDVGFQCYIHMMLCRGGGGGELLMLDVARNTGRNMVATWEEGEGLLIFGCCTQPARNIARNGSQHTCNICSLALNRTAEDLI